MEHSGHFARAGAALLVLAALALLPAAAGAYPSKGGAVEGGWTTVRLDGRLRAALDAAGVEVTPIAPGREAGGKGAVVLPIDEGLVEPRFRSGYVFQRGGIRLRAGGRTVIVKRLVLNTTKKRLSGAVAGYAITLATVDDVHARRTDFGVVIDVRSLRLTAKAAAVLGERLGLPGLIHAGRPLGRAFVSARLFTLPVTRGTIEFSLDEGFRQKLESLGIAVSPYEAATPLSPLPLAFSFPEIKGSIDRRLAHGGIATTNDGIRLVQAGSPEPREVIWRSIGLGFENGFGGEGSDVVTASWSLPLGLGATGPIGQIEFGSSPSFDARTGTFSEPPTAATLSPYAVPPLNDAFAAGKSPPPFVAGEPLGTFAFSARVR